jgi:hypothetical protein
MTGIILIILVSVLAVIARSGATKQSHGLSNGYGIALSAVGLLAMTNGAFFKGLLD